MRSALCGCFDGLRTVLLRLKPEAKLVRHSLVHSFAPGMAWSRALSVAGASMSVDLDSDVEVAPAAAAVAGASMNVDLDSYVEVAPAAAAGGAAAFH